MTEPLIAAAGLRVAFGPVEVVRGVDLAVGRGEAVGLVGESGSGKSMTALALMRLLPHGARISGGDIRLGHRSLLALSERAMAAVRGREVAMIFQDPMTALNPAFTIGRQLADAVRAHAPLGRHAAIGRAVELLHMVGMPAPRSRLLAYPHEFSGGMRQRVAIAIALACNPKLLIADEPTTALDVTVQAQVVDLLTRLREELGIAILFISHNLDLVAEICDRVIVMYAGALVEADEVCALFGRPRHPYTQQLLRCIPRLGAGPGEMPIIPGAPPRAGMQARGCAFAPRCEHAFDRCRVEAPPFAGRVACWLAST